MPQRTFLVMGSRLLAPGLAFAALLADVAGVHGLAFWLVLAALPAAAAFAFAAISDALAGEGALGGVTGSFALVLLLLGSAVRESAPLGGHVPVLAVSSIVMALLCYTVPGFLWVLEPLRSVRTARPTRHAARA
ncbi:MAG TPA: hypothetical protein VIE38_05225 [Gaiellaceae bacterium]